MAHKCACGRVYLPEFVLAFLKMPPTVITPATFDAHRHAIPALSCTKVVPQVNGQGNNLYFAGSNVWQNNNGPDDPNIAKVFVLPLENSKWPNESRRVAYAHLPQAQADMFASIEETLQGKLVENGVAYGIFDTTPTLEFVKSNWDSALSVRDDGTQSLQFKIEPLAEGRTTLVYIDGDTFTPVPAGVPVYEGLRDCVFAVSGFLRIERSGRMAISWTATTLAYEEGSDNAVALTGYKPAESDETDDHANKRQRVDEN